MVQFQRWQLWLKFQSGVASGFLIQICGGLEPNIAEDGTKVGRVEEDVSVKRHWAYFNKEYPVQPAYLFASGFMSLLLLLNGLRSCKEIFHGVVGEMNLNLILFVEKDL